MANSHSEESFARKRQSDIFLGNLRGNNRSIPIAFEQLRSQAEHHLSDEAYAYVAGSAGQESTKVANRDGFKQWKIVPQMLRDVSSCSTDISLFGNTYPAPFLLAPIGVLEMFDSDADLAVARAASDQQIPFIFSSQASEGIVLTLDTTMLGWRPRDLDLDYLPFLRGMGIAQYTSDPVFRKMMQTSLGDADEKPTLTFNAVKALIQMAQNYPGGF